MQLNLAIDSGGTSVRCILYDENFLPIKEVCVGSMRQNTTPGKQIAQSLQELEEKLFHGEKPVLCRVSGVASEALTEFIYDNYKVNTGIFTSEDSLGLYAASIFGDGMLAVSGTGSKIYALLHGKSYTLGGYGAMISDEGSGYWMGRLAFDAAIKCYEGRGEKTLLRELICKKLGSNDLRERIRSIYSMEDISPTAFVASCASLISDAAYKGDKTALNIVRRTGKSLGEQACALARLDGIPDSVPLTISGSVWKGHPEIISEFVRVVREKMPERKIVIPKFEPIIGAIIAHYYELYGEFTISDMKRFSLMYSNYLYNIKTEGMKI